MTTTITFTPKEVEELIRQQLRTQGYEVDSVSFSVTQGSSDPREPSGPGLSSVSARVKPAARPASYGHSSLASQIAAVEAGNVIQR